MLLLRLKLLELSGHLYKLLRLLLSHFSMFTLDLGLGLSVPRVLKLLRFAFLFLKLHYFNFLDELFVLLQSDIIGLLLDFDLIQFTFDQGV